MPNFIAYIHYNNVLRPHSLAPWHPLLSEHAGLLRHVKALPDGNVIISFGRIMGGGGNRTDAFMYELVEEAVHRNFRKGFAAVCAGMSDCSDPDNLSDIFNRVKATGSWAQPIAMWEYERQKTRFEPDITLVREGHLEELLAAASKNGSFSIEAEDVEKLVALDRTVMGIGDGLKSFFTHQPS